MVFPRIIPALSLVLLPWLASAGEPSAALHHYPQRFTRDGAYVAPHVGPVARHLPRGYFAADPKQAASLGRPGYREPALDPGGGPPVADRSGRAMQIP